MIVFRTFFKVLKKYKVSLLMYLGISIGIITILSSFGSKGNTAYYSVSQQIVVKNNDNSEVSKGLIEYLSTINGIKSADDYSDDQITDIRLLRLPIAVNAAVALLKDHEGPGYVEVDQAVAEIVQV